MDKGRKTIIMWKERNECVNTQVKWYWANKKGFIERRIEEYTRKKLMNPKKRGKTFLNIIPKSRELLLHCTINEYFSEKELSNGCQALIESKFSIKNNNRLFTSQNHRPHFTCISHIEACYKREKIFNTA